MRQDDGVVRSAEQIEEILGTPTEIVFDKVRPALDRHARAFLILCPFVCIGTQSVGGEADVSPRGDDPGFVKVVDEHKLVLPERPGNRRADSLRNLLENPAIGMLAFVPGFEEVLRVNGRGQVVTDPELLAGTAARGRATQIGIVVTVEEVYFHCAKSIKRSRLWNPAFHADRSAFPSVGTIMRDQIGGSRTAEQIDAAVTDSQRKDL